MAGDAAAAFEYHLARGERGLRELRLGAPAAVQVAQPPAAARRQPPVGGVGLPDQHGRRVPIVLGAPVFVGALFVSAVVVSAVVVSAVPQRGPAVEHVEAVVDAVGEGDEQRVAGVGEIDFQCAGRPPAGDPVAPDAPFDVPGAVGELDLERRLVEAQPAPRHVLVGALADQAELRLVARHRTGRRCQQAGQRLARQRAAPVQVAQRRPVVGEPERVGGRLHLGQPHARGLVVPETRHR